MADRVRRPMRFDDLLVELTRDTGIFKTYKDALVFAACLGYSRGKRVAFEKSSEPINVQIFSGKFDQMVINTVAIAELTDPYVMASDRQDERLKIFEEYACGGLEIMENEIGHGGLSMDEGLINLILQAEDGGRILDEITDLAKR